MTMNTTSLTTIWDLLDLASYVAEKNKVQIKKKEEQENQYPFRLFLSSYLLSTEKYNTEKLMHQGLQ